LDVKASEKIDTLLSDNCEYTELHGINYRTRYFNNDTNLDAEEATKLFSEWYNTDGVYNYFFEPLNNRDGKYVIQHRMFIIKSMELLINCHQI